MNPKRNTSIDFLRGLAVLMMIAIHVTAYYLHQKTTYIIWDYIHFVVPIFAFCSAYVYFEKKSNAPFNLGYIIKRAKRLLIPYYIFLIPFFSYVWIFNRKSFTAAALEKYFLLQGDRDLNWLVILFLYILLLLPFIKFLSGKKYLLWIFFGISVTSSILLMFIKIPIHFRLYMWLPWSIVLLFAYMVATLKDKKRFLFFSALLWLISFLLGRYLVQILGKTLVLTENKYPPNLYYLSYGMFWISIVYLIHNNISVPQFIQTSFDFLSKYSYSLFFVHFLYLFVIIGEVKYKMYPWWAVSIFLLAISIVTQLILNYLFNIKRLTFFRR